MLTRQALETMAVRWAKQYRPALLPELNQEGPKAAQEWARERATAVLEDYQRREDQIMTAGSQAAEMQTQLLLAREQVLADHFPATSVGPVESLPPEGRRRLEDDRRRTLQREMEEFNQTAEQAEATWEALKEQAAREILEDLEWEALSQGQSPA